MGGRVSHFRVGREGGHILTDKNNFLSRLRLIFSDLQHSGAALYGALACSNLQPYPAATSRFSA